MVKPKTIRPVDKYVGMRVRQRRIEMRRSQEVLAAHIGVTFQQVQKYEKGTNRISPSRLADIARILEVPISWFFEGMPLSPGQKQRQAWERPPHDEEMMQFVSTRDGQRLIKAYQRISNDGLRRAMLEVFEAAVTKS